MRKRGFVVILTVVMSTLAPSSNACTRILYESGTRSYITGRSMDWNDPHAQTSLWVFPKGMKKDGGTGDGAITWTSKYGSVTASFYDAATADGMNEAGLAGNALYLAEADYGDSSLSATLTLSVGAWLQYMLDNYATVGEAVDGLKSEPFVIIAPTLPNGRAASVHVSISDPSGDSAIFEYVGGKLQIHHGPKFRVMTNSPIYDKQLAINTYWDEIGGMKMMPGTYSAADRFVRASYNLKVSPKFDDPNQALASVFSMMRTISVPVGIADPEKPNISTTLWRTISDHQAKRYYFDSVFDPSVFWVDIDKLDLNPGARPMKLSLGGSPPLAGEVSAYFSAAQPFKWLAK